MSSKELNAAIVSPRAPYERFVLSVEPAYPGTIGELRAFKEVGLTEVDLGPIKASPSNYHFEIDIVNPELGATHFLMWKRS